MKKYESESEDANIIKSYCDYYRSQGLEKRLAFEWFVLDHDEFYWNLAKRRIDDETNKLRRRLKKTTALAVTSTVISTIAIVLHLFV